MHLWYDDVQNIIASFAITLENFSAVLCRAFELDMGMKVRLWIESNELLFLWWYVHSSHRIRMLSLCELHHWRRKTVLLEKSISSENRKRHFTMRLIRGSHIHKGRFWIHFTSTVDTRIWRKRRYVLRVLSVIQNNIKEWSKPVVPMTLSTNELFR